MEFGLLGPLLVADDGREVWIRPGGQRTILATLLLRANQVVSIEELVARLWNSVPPPKAKAALHAQVARLRRALGTPDPIRTVPAGYQIRVPAGHLDLERFDALVRRASDIAEPAERSRHLSEALALWRGPALTDVACESLQREVVPALTERRNQAVEHRIDADLRLGRHAEVISELRTLTAESPLRERFWGLLMIALYRSGQQAEALGAYRTVRGVLVDALGVEPGAELRRLERGVLRDDLQLQPRPVTVPALLPPDIPDFSGRAAQIGRLESILDRDPAVVGQTPALAVAIVAGMGGVGKTALAVRVAHRTAVRFPDGQLFVNLRGAEPNPLDPADVLARFLRSTGVDSRAVPDDPAERAALYRSRLAGRRMLVVLDNAATEEQVRPLLPGASTCAVLVTSRARLAGLEGAHWIDLDVFAPEDALELLANVVGHRRLSDEPTDAAEIVRLCGRLPLAVRVAAARLTTRPSWRLAHLAGMLRDERRRLDQLTIGDLEVRASLALSYQGLDDTPRRLLRMLGLFDAPDLPSWLGACLLGLTCDEAYRYLDALVDAQLLAITGTDRAGRSRYRLHDLVRLYARERAAAEDGPDRQAAVVARGLGAWLAIAERLAADVPGPCYAAIHGSAPRPAVDYAFDTDPLVWFDGERTALLVAVGQACDLGLVELAFDLAGCLEKYFDIRGMYVDWRATNERVTKACRLSGHLLGEAVMFRGLIDVMTWHSGQQGGEAMARLLTNSIRLKEMFTAVGERRGMADAGVLCSWGLSAHGSYPEAIAAATTALRLAEDSGHPGGQARAHVALAIANGEQSRFIAAFAHLTNALRLARAVGNSRYEATVLQFLGIAYERAGQLDAGRRVLDESLAISRRYRDHYAEALTMLTLARLYLKSDDPRARSAAEVSLSLGREYHMTHHIADACGVLGTIELAGGRHAEAVAHLEQSVRLWRTRGWPSFLAAALSSLGGALQDADPAAAREAWQEAREIFVKLGSVTEAAELAELLYEDRIRIGQ